MKNKIHTDIIIVGGGSAGVAAAVAAAGQGLRVILFEKNDYLGGKATAAEVGTICGLYKFSKNDLPEYIVKGFAKEFAETIRLQSGSTPLHTNNGLHYLPYKIDQFKSICGGLLQKNNIAVYYHAVIIQAIVEIEKINTITVSIDGETNCFTAKAFVDCSGESIISKTAQLPLIKSDHFQAAAQVFTIQNIKADGLTETTLGMLLMKELTMAIHAGILEHYFDRIYVVPGSLKDGMVSAKIGIPLAVTNTSENKKELRDLALVIIEKLMKYLVQHVAIFKDSTIQHIAPEVGIRLGLRGKGKHVLTEEDVLQCRKFDDAIANGSWPIEEWQQNRRVKMQYFALEDNYQIPAGCLQAENIPNLFYAGRHISATDSGIASARVIGLCLQTGYAAGLLAAGYVKGAPLQQTIAAVQAAQL